MVRAQTFRSDRCPSLVVDGESVFEDCTFLGDEWGEVVVIRGDVTLRRCRVVGGSNRGVVVESGRVLVEDCVITGSRVGLWSSGATTHLTVRRTVCEGPGSLGILIRGGATGLIEDCTLLGLADAAVMLRSGANAVVRRCRLSAGNVAVHLEAFADVHDCEIADSRIGVLVGSGAPTVRDCRIERCFSIGLYFTGPGLIERCDLRGNHIGVCIYEGDPRVVGCVVEGGDNMGLLALDGAGGRFERCRFGAHPNGAVVTLPLAKTVFLD